MKEIRLIDAGSDTMFGRKDTIIDGVTYIRNTCFDSNMIGYVGSIDKYIKAVHLFLENNDLSGLAECGGVFYILKKDTRVTWLKFLKFTDENSIQELISFMNNEEYTCILCEELFNKIFEVFKNIIKNQNNTDNQDTARESSTSIIETTAVVEEETPYDTVNETSQNSEPTPDASDSDEEQKKKERMERIAKKKKAERIAKKLRDLEAYANGRTVNSPTATVIQLPESMEDVNAKNKRKKITRVSNNSSASVSTTQTSEPCTCGCGGHHNHQHGLTDEEYLARLDEASKYGLVAHAQKLIDGIDYNVAPEFVDIEAIKNILNSHTCKYKGEEVYWRAVPNYCLRDNDQSINLANELAQKIKAGELPKLTNNQDFYIQNCPGFNVIDVTSMDPRDNSLIPCLSMIVDYAGVISRGVDANGQSIPLPTIYVGCSMYQADDFMKWANGYKTTRPLILQAIPFTLKNLSVLMSKIDMARCPSK